VDLGNLLRISGYLEGAWRALEESLAIQTELELMPEKVRTLVILGLHALRTGALLASRPFLEQAVLDAQQSKDRQLLAMSLEAQGIGMSYLGQFLTAVDLMKQCAEIRALLGQKVQLSISHSYISLMQLHHGENKEAESNARYAHHLAIQTKDQSAIATALWASGAVALVMGNREAARKALLSSISAYETGWQQDWLARQGILHAALGIMDCHVGNLPTARHHLMRAFKLSLQNHSYIGLVHTLPTAALYYYKKGNISSAHNFLKLAKEQPFSASSRWFMRLVDQHIII
jgi:tetratricopeptide (TPR) repeat protein